jgi:CheY-like chemotaxis protein
LAKKILIIDDDFDIVEAMRMTLEAHGYEVETAYTGEDGLRRVKEVNPDLIILDVMMEDDTAGFKVSWALRNTDPKSEFSQHRGIPLLMITSISEKKGMRFDPKTDGDFLPVDEFIAKPVMPKVLLEKVETLLLR